MKAVYALVLLAIASIIALTTAQGFESNSISTFSSSQGGHGQGFGGQGRQHGGGQGGHGGFGQQGFEQGQGAEGFGPNREYLPPNQNGEPAPGHSFDADGYRYKNPSQF